MPDDETTVHEPVQVATEEWAEEPIEDLPPRPRRRLLGAGGNPIALALLGVLLIACGFIGGVLVEKGQTSPSSSGTSAAGLASRFAALRSDAGATGGAGGASGFGGGASRLGAGAGATAGSVAYVSGDTLYVTNAEGNTVKVVTSAGSTVTKTVSSEIKDIHPGETVVFTGAAGANGAIAAESIRVGGGAGGGLGALFGGAGGGRGGGGTGSASGAAGGGGSSGSGEPALFGKGG